MIWVTTIDSTTCRIYEFKNHKHISLIREIIHPENKLRDIELTSDRPGRYKSSNSSHGAYSQPTDPKEILIDNFSKEVAHELDAGRTKNCYERLIIIAPPHMNGLLSKNINKHVNQLISHRINKDVMHLTEHELLNFITTHAQYPG